MKQFFTKSQCIAVSQIDNDGWWIQNTQEHVAAHTALSNDFTTNLYTPSANNMIARYNRDNDVWSDEVQDKRGIPYYDENGQQFRVVNIDDAYQSWAIFDVPPAHDADTQTVHYHDGAWHIYPIKIGDSYYDSEGNAFVIADFNFELPDEHTYIAPPKADIGYVVRFDGERWQQIKDNRGVVIYNTANCNENKPCETLSIPIDWTDTTPSTACDSWDGMEWITDTDALYLYQCNQVNDTRRSLYLQMCDPLIAEAQIKRLQDKTDEACMLEARALAAREKIQEENPFPDIPI